MPKFPIQVRRGSAVVKVRPYSNNGSPHFLVCWNLLGTRRRESRSTLGAAKTRAAEIATSIANGQLAALTLTGADRDSYVQATKLLAPLGVPLHAAIAEYVEARIIAGANSLIDVAKDFSRRNLRPLKIANLDELVKKCLEQKKADGLSSRYVTQLRSDLTRFSAAFAKPIGAITTDELDEWIRSLKIAPRTRNNLRTSVNTFFAFCQRNGYLPKELPTEAQGITRVKIRDQRIAILKPDQMQKLLAKANREMIPFIVIGGFSGLRSAEIQRLKWEDVMLERGWIEVRPENAKTASRRLAPISENLRAWLSPLVGTGKLLDKPEIWRDVTALANKLGIKWEKNVLRHSAISYRIAATQDVNKVALESGNTPAIIFKHYREVVSPAQAEVWWSICPPAEQCVRPSLSSRPHG